MKKVFSNSSEVIHIWAQQTQESGRCSNVYFEGTTRLYSYGAHYPLGLFVENKKGEKAVIINTQGYSSTTSGHILGAKYATNHYKQFYLPNTATMKSIEQVARYGWNEADLKKHTVSALSEAIVTCVESYFYSLRSDTMKLKAATLESWKNTALSKCDSYIVILDWYGFKMTPAAKKALAKLSGLSPVAAKEAAQKAKALEGKKRLKAEKERQKRNEAYLALCIPAWQNGEAAFLAPDSGEEVSTRFIANASYVYLRVASENIETSKGAKFSIEHGLKALPLIEAAKEKGWHKNGHTIHLGHYQIDEILPNGDVKAGCHFVPYAEINRIALILKA